MKVQKSDGSTDTYVTTKVDNITFEKIECIDIDGNEYKVIRIGDQWWMAENLKVTHYRNGDPIPNITDNSTWEGLSAGARCYQENDSTNNAGTYGCLYNWYAVDSDVDGDGKGDLAPEGWHVPTDAEWTVLENYLTANGHSGSEGTALKSTTGWNSGGNGTDDYGFAGLPAGYRYYFGTFYTMGYYATFWSASEYDTYNAWYRALYCNGSDVYRYGNYEDYGFSVRCVRD